jgi:integrase/recombinase XerD
MTAFSSAAADYLTTRRALGYKLAQQGQMLAQFVAYLEAVDAEYITVGDALAWAQQPVDADPVWWSAKLCVVRGFARFLQAVDPRTEVPPIGLVPEGNHRAVPYIYSQGDIDRVLSAAGQLGPPHRADTYQTMIALLAVTGMRVGEAVGLDRADLDWDQGLLTIRHAKFGKARQLPLHPSTVEALAGYARRRDERQPEPKSPSFFVSTVGTRVIRDNVTTVFGRLVRAANLDWSGRRRPPRAHDLRHSFAVRTMISWYRDGLDVQQRLPLLSTFMGHVGPASTYWYLSAVPELLALAADRMEASWEPQP